MPIKKKKAKTAATRAPNQPSLLSFWGKKTSSGQRQGKNNITAAPVNKEDSSKHHNSVAVLQDVGNKSKHDQPATNTMMKGKKRRVVEQPIQTLACIDPQQQQQQQQLLQSSPVAQPMTTPTPQTSVTPEATNILAVPRDGKQNSDEHKNVDDLDTRGLVAMNASSPPTTPRARSKGDDQAAKDEPHAEDSDEEDQQAEEQNVSTMIHDNPEGLSEYELLRLRNIARNNARLEALGLVNPTSNMGSSAWQGAKKKVKRPVKRPAKSASNPQRRSTRLVKSTTTTVTTSIDGSQPKISSTTASATTALSPMEVEKVEVEQYEVSPIVQYEMKLNNPIRISSDKPKTSAEAHRSSLSEEGGVPNVSSLLPTRRRLAPSQGLSAIYSLKFSNDGDWLVGAGKSGAVALWNCQDSGHHRQVDDGEPNVEVDYVDPIFTWKAHNGRWISEAQFLDVSPTSMMAATPSTNIDVINTATAPSRLVTAANDGTVCLWDLSKVSTTTGTPKLLQRSDKSWHASGIFAMDTRGSNTSTKIVTGSKDKTVAVASHVEDFGCPVWRSHVHTAKVGAVQFRDDHVLASASDDGCVAILDDRMKDGDAAPVALLEGLHNGRPHSVVWDHHLTGPSSPIFLTAGSDSVIQAWDSRYLKGADGQPRPVREYVGHVPTTTRRCKRIHHPVLYSPFKRRNKGSDCFVLTGGEGSHALSMFQCTHMATDFATPSTVEMSRLVRSSVYSRGMLPPDCNHTDVGSIAIFEDRVAVSVEGEVLLLKPST